MSNRSSSEEEYFARIEAEKKAAIKKELDEENQRKAAQERLEAVHGRCGRCGGTFEAKLFRGVEIDICVGCGAVLLDPGELEELVGEDESGVLVTLADFFRFTKGGQ